MPIYEYVCQNCGKKTEAIQRVGEKPLRVCPHCGGKLKKAFSAPAIQFKGSGWYITDYARAKKEEKAEKADKSENAEKTPEKSDKGEKTSKPEKKEKKAKE
jgi:putative FmdB family regulatory protein